MLANAVMGIINALLSCLVSFTIVVINDVLLIIDQVKISIYLAPSSSFFYIYI